jgi:hypothetical protein
MGTLEAIRFSKAGGTTARLQLLEQRKLPLVTEWIEIDGPRAAWTAISDMTVRGAPAIGAPLARYSAPPCESKAAPKGHWISVSCFFTSLPACLLTCSYRRSAELGG